MPVPLKIRSTYACMHRQTVICRAAEKHTQQKQGLVSGLPCLLASLWALIKNGLQLWYQSVAFDQWCRHHLARTIPTSSRTNARRRGRVASGPALKYKSPSNSNADCFTESLAGRRGRAAAQGTKQSNQPSFAHADCITKSADLDSQP